MDVGDVLNYCGVEKAGTAYIVYKSGRLTRLSHIITAIIGV
jgi:hypothetical protein